jgi:heme oxygenase
MQHELLSRLKKETAACHTRLERALDLMRDDWQRDEYVALLECFLGYVAPWEQAVSAHMPAHLRGFFEPRRKSALIAADLETLTGRTPRAAAVRMADAATGLPALDSLGRLFGSMYVMEGSTLGGRFISPHVAHCLGFGHGRGHAYFEGYGERTGSMWNAFRETAAATVPAAEYDDAAAAAIATFEGLHAWIETGLAEARAMSGAAA